MDDEQVLRSLGRDLERDDPRLAGLLTGGPPHRFHPVWTLLGLAVVGALLLLPVTVAVGVFSILLIAGSLLVVCWSCTNADGGAAPRL
jgi:hypothetical protein